MRKTWLANMRSRSSSMRSSTINSRSKRERSESGSAMFLCGSLLSSYCVAKFPRRHRWCIPDEAGDASRRSYHAIDWVGCGEHAAAGVQRGVDAGLGDCDGLLLHDFVDCNAVDVAHLVKLVDAHHTAIAQNHCTCLK